MKNFSSKSSDSTKVRKVVSKEERSKLRASRRDRAAATIKQAQTQAKAAESSESATTTAASSASAPKPKPSSGLSAQSTRYLMHGGLTIPAILISWAIYDPDDSPPGKFFNWIGISSVITNFVDEFAQPAHAKLLPDWSQMPNVPHDIPVPHTLVLDLENTLVSSTWDRKFGWRHAKRPGVDKFLRELAQYYEIVLFSPSHDGIADPVVNNLDPSGCIMHRLYRESTHYINGTHVKDLSKLNRNLNRIVALDDDHLALQLQPRNLIRVKSYEDPNDRSDRTLLRLLPLLIEIAREGCQDVPTLLDQFKDMDADQIADEHERRIKELRVVRDRRAERGLGKFAMAAKRNLPVPELQAHDELSLLAAPAPKSLTSKDLVGSGPTKDAGGVIGWFNKRQKDQQEEQMRKMEKWNEVMMKKQMEKKQQEEAKMNA